MRKSLKLAATTLIASAICSAYIAPVFAQNYQNPYNYNRTPNQPYGQNQTYGQNYLPPLQGRVSIIPAGTSLPAITTNDISSEFLTVGDNISVVLGSDFYYNGAVALPANSIIEGNIVIAEKAGMAGKNGKLKIRFTSAITPNGQRIPLSGKLATEDGSGLLVGGTGMDRAAHAVKNAAVGAGTGAIFGTVIGAITGKTGRGAWSGTAVGGGLGLGKTIIEKGNQAMIPSNSKVDIVLDQPLTVNPAYNY